MNWRKWGLWGVSIAVSFLAFLGLGLPWLKSRTVHSDGGNGGSGVAAPASERVDLGPLPGFTLRDQAGKEVVPSAMRGKAWIAGFVFTRCRGPCPRVIAAMREAEQGTPPGVGLAIFTVDPDFDTPEVLSAYAREIGVGPRWTFLTGPREPLYSLIREGFLLGVADASAVNPDHSITHSTRLVLLDAGLRIRGYFDSADPLAMRRLVQAAKAMVTK